MRAVLWLQRQSEQQPRRAPVSPRGRREPQARVEATLGNLGCIAPAPWWSSTPRFSALLAAFLPARLLPRCAKERASSRNQSNYALASSSIAHCCFKVVGRREESIHGIVRVV